MGYLRACGLFWNSGGRLMVPAPACRIELKQFSKGLLVGAALRSALGAKRALCGIAVRRKYDLFAGSSRSVERATVFHSVIVTAKLNGLDQEAILHDFLDCPAPLLAELHLVIVAARAPLCRPHALDNRSSLLGVSLPAMYTRHSHLSELHFA